MDARSTVRAGVVAALCAIVAGCASDGRELRPATAPLPPSTTTTTIPVTAPLVPLESQIIAEPVVASSAPIIVTQLVLPWQNDATIPTRHTCDGEDLMPALSWSGLPEDTVEVALTFTDLDADFTHFAITGLDPQRGGLSEGEEPAGARRWTNDFGVVEWRGPCPPTGDAPHRYLFALYALNQQVEAADDLSAADLVALLNQLSIAQHAVSGLAARTE